MAHPIKKNAKEKQEGEDVLNLLPVCSVLCTEDIFVVLFFFPFFFCCVVHCPGKVRSFFKQISAKICLAVYKGLFLEPL